MTADICIVLYNRWQGGCTVKRSRRDNIVGRLGCRKIEQPYISCAYSIWIHRGIEHAPEIGSFTISSHPNLGARLEHDELDSTTQKSRP